MAKKSARSKGYRKLTNQKKPYLSKKEIIALVVIVAVIALAVVLINNFYDDGSLKVRGGAVQVKGENSIIYNANNIEHPKYYKVGEIHEIEGYTLESAMFGSDENIHRYTLKPEAEDSADTITITGSKLEAQSLARSMPAQLTYNGVDASSVEIQQLESDEHPVWYFVTDYTVQAPAETAADAAGEEAEAATEEPAEEAEAATEEPAEETEAAAEEPAEENEAAAEETETAAEETEAAAEETAEETEAAAEESAEETEAAAEETAEETETATEEPAEDAADATEEASAEPALLYNRELSAYVSNGNTRTVCIHIIDQAEAEEALLDEAGLEQVLQDVLGGLTYETK